MKQTIDIAVNRKEIFRETIKIEVVEKPQYYAILGSDQMIEELFAIIPQKRYKRPYYFLLRISRNEQEYRDFMPHNDCKYEGWMNERGIRGVAFDILSKKAMRQWAKIEEKEFNQERERLLTIWRDEI